MERVWFVTSVSQSLEGPQVNASFDLSSFPLSQSSEIKASR